MKTKFIASLFVFLVFASPLLGAVTVIKGGQIYTMTDGIIENGIIIIENGIITSIGTDIDIPADVEIIDATDKIVMPGLIDGYCRIGLIEISAVKQTVDTEESSKPITPEVRVIDAFNTQSELIPVTRIEGVTTVLSAPGGGNVISGQSAVVNLNGDNLKEMTVKSPAALHVNITEGTVGKWRERKKIDSRMGLVAKLRQAFINGQEYKDKWLEYEKKKSKRKKDKEPKTPSRDLGLEAVALALDGEIPVIASAKRKDDILTAIHIAEEFGLKLILLHATDAYKIKTILKEKNIPVLVGPITTQPSSMENLGAIYQNAAILDNAGIKIGIITSGAHNVRDLRFQAGFAAQYGLPMMSALKAITINPAEILGISDEYGSLEKDKIANIVIFDGDPLQPLTKVNKVFIKGEDIPLESFQTELYERFK